MRFMPEGSPRPFNVKVHPFTSPTPHACAYEQCPDLDPSLPRSHPNAIVYIAGMTAGPHTHESLSEEMSSRMQYKQTGYTFFEFRMRSSYTGFGTSSLANDVEDVSALVKYLREGLRRKKIVLMGSSTGCQAIMRYNSTPNVPNVDGYILQAPTSDRETAGLLMTPEQYNTSLNHATDLITKGEKETFMPSSLLPAVFSGLPITAYRWHSIISPGGDDDYFSSDLSDSTLQTTFGHLKKPTLILMSEKDEMVPESVDKQALLNRWIEKIPEDRASKHSWIIPHADHAIVSGSGWTLRACSGTICKFLKDLENEEAKMDEKKFPWLTER